MVQANSVPFEDTSQPFFSRLFRTITMAFAEPMKLFGKPWLDVVRALEESSPGSAEELIGGFQDDYYEITLAVLGLVVHARVTGDAQLLERARKVLADLTKLMRTFAQILYTQQPERLGSKKKNRNLLRMSCAPCWCNRAINCRFPLLPRTEYSRSAPPNTKNAVLPSTCRSGSSTTASSVTNVLWSAPTPASDRCF